MDQKSQLEHLHECLQREVMMSSKKFTWLNVLHKAFKCPSRRYHFWWRIASYWYQSGSKYLKKRAEKINRKLIFKYGTDIQLGAQIGPGMVISHHQGIVVNGSVVIGHSLRIRQNTTIGITGTNVNKEPISIIIGNNVSIGVGSCIIADQIRIGDNVVIGAMSFVNKDIPGNVTVYTEKSLKLISTKSL
ncbi:MAG TPA: serine acetyltransferase [Scandinavium sp.]|jgi:serine acetyltransferase|uniref:serine acetyltransferase n=1 Tax=Scandinavium sp. TaxID=2830653 RepID=UPI002E2F127D|nr:serine acetyltransferase [Scandinavium sp.]HEX4503152.1 serine acetyltransferase [Scandinavium sp.]